MSITLTITDEQFETLTAAFTDALDYRPPENDGCCDDDDLCEDHANDRRQADEYAELFEELQNQRKDQLQ